MARVNSLNQLDLCYYNLFDFFCQHSILFFSFGYPIKSILNEQSVIKTCFLYIVYLSTKNYRNKLKKLSKRATHFLFWRKKSFKTLAIIRQSAMQATEKCQIILLDTIFKWVLRFYIGVNLFQVVFQWPQHYVQRSLFIFNNYPLFSTSLSTSN